MNTNNVIWNDLYEKGDTGWDVGTVSKPLEEYFNQLENKDLRVLIPGCGYGHEVAYLHSRLGFKNITVVDISEIAISKLKEKIPEMDPKNLICGDFFSLKGNFDLIIEQTFFCAIRPWRRWEYASKMSELLKPGGKLVGLLFSESFDRKGPPFGGSKEEYKRYFSYGWNFKTLEECYNSIPPRAGRELFFILEKID